MRTREAGSIRPNSFDPERARRDLVQAQRVSRDSVLYGRARDPREALYAAQTGTGKGQRGGSGRPKKNTDAAKADTFPRTCPAGVRYLAGSPRKIQLNGPLVIAPTPVQVALASDIVISNSEHPYPIQVCTDPVYTLLPKTSSMLAAGNKTQSESANLRHARPRLNSEGRENGLIATTQKA